MLLSLLFSTIVGTLTSVTIGNGQTLCNICGCPSGETSQESCTGHCSGKDANSHIPLLSAHISTINENKVSNKSFNPFL